MSDSEEEKVERVKKPRTEAQKAAVVKMIEARKASIEAKKKQKEEAKEQKKVMKKQIKEKVIKETNMLNELSPEQIEDMKKKAIGETPLTMVYEEMEPAPQTPSPKPKAVSQRRQPKKKVIVNNYYEEESSDEEEIVNNYYKKKKKKKKAVVVPSSSSEESEEEDYDPPTQYKDVQFNPMDDIVFC